MKFKIQGDEIMTMSKSIGAAALFLLSLSACSTTESASTTTSSTERGAVTRAPSVMTASATKAAETPIRDATRSAESAVSSRQSSSTPERAVPDTRTSANPTTVARTPTHSTTATRTRTSTATSKSALPTRSGRSAAAKTRTCINLGTGKYYTCTGRDGEQMIQEEDTPAFGAHGTGKKAGKRVCVDPFEGTESYCSEKDYQELKRFLRTEMGLPTAGDCVRQAPPATRGKCADAGLGWGSDGP